MSALSAVHAVLEPALEADVAAAAVLAGAVDGDAVVVPVQPASAKAVVRTQQSERSRIEFPPRVVWLDAATYQIYAVRAVRSPTPGRPCAGSAPRSPTRAGQRTPT